MRDLVSEIKARLSIEDVVSSYVQLKKTGRSFKGLCPFHNEKTPSFIVSPEKQIAYCFGCHKGGDIFKFIEEAEGVDFVEAMRILADKAGIKIETSDFKKSKGETSIKDELFEAHEKACQFFEDQLFEKNAKEHLAYLEKRGITEDTIKEFRIGFSGDSPDGLYKFLIKKGFKHDVIVKSGLIASGDISSRDVFDKFKFRLMFPIFDYMGRVIGFGGRALKEDQTPKYLNSPETKIYSKGNVLYGLSHAKKDIKENDRVVIVEGYFDLISLYQAGVKNVVASSGTALTKEQVRLIKRFTKNVVSCFDTDSAGIEATKRAYSVLQEFDMGIKVLQMDKKFKDPADFVLEKGKDSKEEFLKMVGESIDFMEFYSKFLRQNLDVKTLEGRRKFLDEVVPLVKISGSGARTDYYVRMLGRDLDMKEKFLYDEIENFKVLRAPERGGERADAPRLKSGLDAGTVIIALCLEYPKVFEIVKNSVEESDFDGEIKDIYIEMLRQYNPSATSRKNWDFEGEKLACISGKVAFLSLFAEEKYGEFSEESVKIEMEKLIDRVKENRRMHRRIAIEKALKDAESKGDEKQKKIFLEEFRKLLTS
jgi:DNA primase